MTTLEIAEVSFATPWDSISPEVEWYPATPAPEPAAEVAPDEVPLESASAPEPCDAIPAARPSSGGALTIPLICIGVGIIACCLLIPAADENRRLAYERDRLKADLAQLQKQVETNDAFLHRVANDPTLAERLARRQMKMVPEGTSVLALKSQPEKSADMSPFLLVTVPPPAELPPYQPVGGFLANLCRHPKTKLYLIGGSLMMIASGLVLSRTSRDEAAEAGEDEDDHDHEERDADVAFSSEGDSTPASSSTVG